MTDKLMRPSRYITTGTLSEAHRRHMADPDPLDPTEDLILLRSVVDAQVAQIQDGGGGDVTGTLARLDMVSRNIAQLVKLADSIHARRNQYRITAEMLDRLLGQMAEVVEQHTDRETLMAILQDWKGLGRP